jgi:hypothetical protein
MPSPDKRDDSRVQIPLDPETALRALLKVDPESEPVKPSDEPQQREPGDSESKH